MKPSTTSCAALRRGAHAYHVGDKLDEATDMGPIINRAEALRIERTVNEAIHSQPPCCAAASATVISMRPPS